jgi:hypothetical protein
MPLPASDAGPPVSAFHAPAAALTMDAYAAIASQYAYRGVALRDRPTASVALATNTSLGWFGDLWAGLVDGDELTYTQNGYMNPHGNEWDIDVSLGYGASLDSTWQWSIAGARIIDAGAAGPSDDYFEWRANLFFRDFARAQVAYSEDYLQRGWSSWNIEISGSPALTELLRGEWGIGHSHGAGKEDNDYAYGWLGLNGSWLHTQWDARWVDAGHGARYVLDSGRGGGRFVLSLSWSLRLLP